MFDVPLDPGQPPAGADPRVKLEQPACQLVRTLGPAAVLTWLAEVFVP